MFLNKIKDFFIKKRFKKSLRNVKLTDTGHLIKTVGILFDESYFYEKQALLDELANNGISPGAIRFFVFKDAIRKNETFDYPVLSHKDISWAGTIENSEANDFIATRFDLLISYYDTEKAALMLMTQLSNASFKVGFSSVDNRLHHFMIGTTAEHYKVFTDELFKYLKILNKL